MKMARNNRSHAVFSDMFKDRTIKKTYLAVVKGHPDKTGIIDYAIVRHPTHRNKMTHVCTHELSKSWARRARASKTNYEVKEYFDDYTLVAAKPVTGRTHQIRVHAAAQGHPIAGDERYGDKAFNQKMRKCGLRRLFLHSAGISCYLADSEKRIGICAVLDEDLARCLQKL